MKELLTLFMLAMTLSTLQACAGSTNHSGDTQITSDERSSDDTGTHISSPDRRSATTAEQATPADDGKIPQVVKNNFHQKYPEATKVKWNIDSHGYYEADFTLNGVKYRADFHEDGSWRETETSVSYKDLPEAVKNTIKAGYDKNELVEIEWVQSSTDGDFYDVEFRQKGRNHDVQIRKDGIVIGEDG